MDHPRPSAQPPNNINNDKTPVTATLHSPYTATVTPSHQSHHLSLSPEQNFHASTSDPSSSYRSKPRMPRSESFNPSPPHRPEMNRAAHSLYSMAGPGSASQVMFPAAGGDDNGNDDLTTKGRKRKRLAKACSACHKNKRRCDGFDPCSNCEFSSKECMYLNAQGQRIPAPRTRDTSTTPQRPVRDERGRLIQPAREGNGQSDWRPENENGRRSSGDRAWVGPLEAVERDPSLSVELVDLFFNRVQPYAAMFHRPTTLHRMYLRQTSPVLLDMLYALAARHCSHANLVAALPPTQPSCLRGDAFAERANVAAKQFLHLRSTWNQAQRDYDRGTFEETEFAQALYLLSIYYSAFDHHSLSDFFFDEAIAILHPSSSATLTPPPTRLPISHSEHLTLTEIRHRTFWLLVLHDLTSASANNRQRRLQDHEIYNIPLPGDEALWMRYGAEGRSGEDRGRRDGIAVATGSWDGEEGAVGELGHVIRVLLVFHEIINATSGRMSSKLHSAANHEATLWAWSTSLPPSLHFDQAHLQLAVARLSSSVPETSLSGFLYAYMHMIAECAMLYVQASKAAASGISGISASALAPMLRTMENISILLDHLGPRGRESYLTLYPLSMLTEWYDNHRAVSSEMTTEDSQKLLGRLTRWWKEAGEQWGVQSSLRPELPIPEPVESTRIPNPITEPTTSSTNGHGNGNGNGSFPLPMFGSSRSNSCSLAKPSAPHRLSPPRKLSALLESSHGHSHSHSHSRHSVSSNGLGLDLHTSIKMQTSPRDSIPFPFPESASSTTTTTLTLPTPTSAFKYPDMASLAPYRPRAHSNVSNVDMNSSYTTRSPRSPADEPSPMLGLKLGERGDKGFTLPSLGSLGGGNRDRSRSNSWWRDNKQNDRSPLGIAALISAAEERGEV